jgi:hypothetical protein
MTEAVETDPDYMRTTGKWVALAARFISYLVYFYIIVVEIILFLGFFLLLFGANPSSSFVEWAYRNLDRAMTPFRGIFTPIELGTTGGNEVESVFDTSILFAMIIYGIVGILVYSLIQWLTYRIRRIEREEHNEQAAAEAERIRHEMLRSGMPSATTAPVGDVSPAPTAGTASSPTAAGSIPPPPPSTPQV